MLSKQQDDLQSDIDKLSKLLVSLKQHKQTMQKKIAEREADLEAKKQEMSLLQKVNWNPSFRHLL